MFSVDRRVAIVTGGNAGIGRATVLGLAERGFDVVLACRRERAALEVAHEIRERTGANVETLVLDLERRASVRAAASEALSRFPKIHVLVENAGVWSSSRRVGPDGQERTWATNVLGHFLFRRLLEERLSASAPARVVVVASGLAHSLDLSDPSFERRPYRGVAAYAQSKQAGRMLTRASSRRLAGRGVTVNSVHPGFTRTSAFASGGGISGLVAGIGATLFGKSPERAADTVVWLASSDDVRDLSGGYFQDRVELVCSHSNRAQEDALFEHCSQETKCEEFLRVPGEVTAAEVVGDVQSSDEWNVA